MLQQMQSAHIKDEARKEEEARWPTPPPPPQKPEPAPAAAEEAPAAAEDAPAVAAAYGIAAAPAEAAAPASAEAPRRRPFKVAAAPSVEALPQQPPPGPIAASPSAAEMAAAPSAALAEAASILRSYSRDTIPPPTLSTAGWASSQAAAIPREMCAARILRDPARCALTRHRLSRYPRERR